MVQLKGVLNGLYLILRDQDPKYHEELAYEKEKKIRALKMKSIVNKNKNKQHKIALKDLA